TLAQANNMGAITVNAGTGNVSITEAAAMSIAAINHTGNLTLNAGANDITQTGVINVGAGTANLTGGNITLGQNNVLGAITVNAGTGNVSITEADPIAIAGITHTGNLALSGGAVTQSGAINVTGTTSVNAGANTITLGSGNTFGGAVSLTTTGANAATVNTTGALTLGTNTVGGNLTATAGGALNLGAGSVGDNLAATGVGISQTGALSVTNTSTLNAGTGTVLLTNTANTLTGLITANASGTTPVIVTGPSSNFLQDLSISLASSGALNVGTLNSGGSVNLVAGTTITGSGAWNITPTGTKTGDLNIKLGGSSSTFPTDLVKATDNMRLFFTAPSGTFTFQGSNNTPLTPAGTDFSAGITSIVWNGSPLIASLAAGVVGSISGTAAAIATAELKNAFGTDSVVQIIEFGFTGDIGLLPPFAHVLNGDGILVPACVGTGADQPGCF
ncbi:MAG TPA: hypothetical protein VIS77_04855, partial [Burkholderiales bacterium]